jgi:hypothetical protein
MNNNGSDLSENYCYGLGGQQDNHPITDQYNQYDSTPIHQECLCMKGHLQTPHPNTT